MGECGEGGGPKVRRWLKVRAEREKVERRVRRAGRVSAMVWLGEGGGEGMIAELGGVGMPSCGGGQDRHC